VKLLGWSAWQDWQHRCRNGVGQWVRVCLLGCRKPESRAPFYKPRTFLLMREMDTNKPPHRIHGETLSSLGFRVDSIEISAGGVSVSVITRHEVGDRRRWAAPRPRATEALAGSAGPTPK
jgi:hypothetical protein